MSENPKVFISYSHESTDFEEKVLEFSNRLRSEGIDANIDLYEEAPCRIKITETSQAAAGFYISIME